MAEVRGASGGAVMAVWLWFFFARRGGGVDLSLRHKSRFALRPQLEFFGFRSQGPTTGSVRLSIGIV